MLDGVNLGFINRNGDPVHAHICITPGVSEWQAILGIEAAK